MSPVVLSHAWLHAFICSVTEIPDHHKIPNYYWSWTLIKTETDVKH